MEGDDFKTTLEVALQFFPGIKLKRENRNCASKACLSNETTSFSGFCRLGISDTLGSRGYFFLVDISRRSRVNEAQSAEERKITSGHRSMQPHFHARNQFRNWTGSPIGYSHVKLFDVANQGHCYIVNSLRTWEYPIGDPVQFLNWFHAWKWGCMLLWPEVIFFSSALCASLTRLRREISIRKKYPLEPRVGIGLVIFIFQLWGLVRKQSSLC